jgi:RNA-directed DNA polymerase
MSQLSALKTATTLHDVAALLSFRPSALSYVLYVLHEDKKYTSFEVPKRSGGTRTISAPTSQLKLVQARLANVLQNCSDEISKSNKRSDEDAQPDRISHGFKRRRSIITNARQHRNKRFVFNLDLEDFFGSINFGRVRGFFLKDKNFSLHPKVATLLAQIACRKSTLPQGSPCSPVISNLVGHILDIHLAKLAARTGCTYTRYADDLTFSTNKQIFPELIAIRSPGTSHSWVAGTELCALITKSGFAINVKKTRMQYRDSRQEVTGLIVNRKINVRHEYRHLVRSMVHRLLTTGTFQHTFTTVDSAGAKSTTIADGKLGELHGMLGFIDGVDLLNKADSTAASNNSQESKESAYRRFLLFKEFYASAAPLIVCEGKTDNVYLTHAIRSLADKYPKLATIDSAGKITIQVRRFKYAGTSTGRILKINGGTGDLCQFIRSYKRELKRFKAPGQSHPVIILIDNDDGASSIYSTIKEITRVKHTREERFIRVFGNLYVVPTPLCGAKTSAIEDSFNQVTLAIPLGGKTFSRSNDFDRHTQYGKSDFAYEVVAKYANTIDFSGFIGIFDRIVDVIDEHAKTHLTAAAKP